MQWVTLITDFGLKDPHIGQIKGTIVKAFPEIQFIDFTHDIKSHDMVMAGWILKSCFRDAPLGTIHAVSVFNNFNNLSSYIAFKHEGYYFIGPNNGLFSIAFDNLPTEIIEIEVNRPHHSFSVKDIFGYAIAHLANGYSLESLGRPVRNLILRIQLQPVINKHMIRGSVIYVDHYENVIINITKDQFEKTRAGRAFSIYMKRNDPLQTISQNYQDVVIGETLCLFNSNGYLEIAINSGTAASMLSLGPDETIQIDFYNEQDKI